MNKKIDGFLKKIFDPIREDDEDEFDDGDIKIADKKNNSSEINDNQVNQYDENNEVNQYNNENNEVNDYDEHESDSQIEYEPYMYVPYDNNTVTEDDKVQQVVIEKNIEKKSVVISILIDTTYSMRKIFSRIYRYLINEVNSVSFSNADIKWRLCLIREKDYEFIGELSTDDFIRKIRDITLKGGSESGYEECIISSLASECSAMKNVEADLKGLLLITDTSPSVEHNSVTINSDHLSFCILYLYDVSSVNIINKSKNIDIYSIRNFIDNVNMPNLKVRIESKINMAE